MSEEKYIFDIAVYITNSENFFSERHKKLQKHFDWLNKMSLYEEPQWSITSNKQLDLEAKDYFNRKYGGWQFTQAIGWIRLFPLFRQMRGEYWFVPNKRIGIHMNRKKFEFYGKAFELTYFTGKESSIDIFTKVKERIEKLNFEKPFIGRYIDIEPFINLGPFINWRKLIALD